MNSSFPADQTLFGRRSNQVASCFLLLLSQTTRNRLGQSLRTVEALGTEAERITRFRWHASGQMSHLILENPATGEQVTEWVFGTNLATSGIARNDLVSGKVWPTGESESHVFICPSASRNDLKAASPNLHHSSSTCAPREREGDWIQGTDPLISPAIQPEPPVNALRHLSAGVAPPIKNQGPSNRP